MKKILAMVMSVLMIMPSIYAAEGEMSSFGGISTGIPLKTLTTLSQMNTKTAEFKGSLPYKENVYLSGKAEPVEGTIEIKPGKGMDKEAGTGSYTESYIMKAKNADNTTRVTRTISLDTKYTYDSFNRKAVKESTVKKWTEIITVNGKTYILDGDLSNYTKSVIEDYTPGVMYYRGDIHYTAVYKPTGSTNSNVTITVNAPIYGYDQAYAKSETQKRTITIDLGNGDGYAIEEVPTFTAYRDIQYGTNEPTAISMEGNYKEILRSEGALSFNILQGHPSIEEEELSGMLGVDGDITINQLSYPTTLKLNNHPAQSEIRKMYSMKIFDSITDTPLFFSTNQIVTKEQYIKMLITALQIPLSEETKGKSKSKKVEEISPFSDLSTQSPYYKYAKAAYDAGLVSGGRFYGGTYITREMMYNYNVKAIGLQRLGIGTMSTYTPFIDDNQISDYAKEAIYAASKLGLIEAQNGYVFPRKKVTKAECATFLNQLIDYLRYDLKKDYSEKMMI